MILITTKSPNAELRGATLRVRNLVRYYDCKVEKILVLSIRKIKNEFYQGIPVIYLSVRPRDVMTILRALFFESISSALFKRAELKLHVRNNEAVIFHLLRPYQPTPAKRISVDMCESLAENFSNRSEFYKKWDARFWFFKIESIRLKQLEEKIWRDKRVEKILITRSAFTKYQHLPCRVIPNWREIPEIDFRQAFDEQKIAFLGHVDYELNLASIIRLQAWIANISAKMTLEVVGTVNQRNRRLLSKFENIRLHGFIDDPQPLLSKCVVGVCIINGATGLQNKVLDYLAYGIPPIVSRNVCAAFPGAAPFSVADGPDEFSSLLQKFTRIHERQTYLQSCVNYVRKTERQFFL